MEDDCDGKSGHSAISEECQKMMRNIQTQMDSFKGLVSSIEDTTRGVKSRA